MEITDVHIVLSSIFQLNVLPETKMMHGFSNSKQELEAEKTS